MGSYEKMPHDALHSLPLLARGLSVKHPGRRPQEGLGSGRTAGRGSRDSRPPSVSVTSLCLSLAPRDVTILYATCSKPSVCLAASR